MARLVLTDARPAIGLARIDGLAWLGAPFGVVWSARRVFARLPGCELRISSQVIETVLRRVGE